MKKNNKKSEIYRYIFLKFFHVSCFSFVPFLFPRCVSPLQCPVVVPRVDGSKSSGQPFCQRARARVGGISPVRVEVLEPNLFIIFSFFCLYVSSFFSICHRLFIAFLCFFSMFHYFSLLFIVFSLFFITFHCSFIVFSMFFSIVLKF